MIVAWNPSTRWICVQREPEHRLGQLDPGANADERHLRGHHDAEQRRDRRDQEVVAAPGAVRETTRRCGRCRRDDGLEYLLNARNEAISITTPATRMTRFAGESLSLSMSSSPQPIAPVLRSRWSSTAPTTSAIPPRISNHAPICLSPCR